MAFHCPSSILPFVENANKKSHHLVTATMCLPLPLPLALALTHRPSLCKSLRSRAASPVSLIGLDRQTGVKVLWTKYS